MQPICFYLYFCYDEKVETKIDYGAILSKHGLSKTPFRMELLALFTPLTNLYQSTI